MTTAEAESDADLVRRARAGEQRAFSLLMGRHKHWLYRFVRRYVGDAEEAYDVLQDAFVAALSNLSRYDPGRPFEAWLRRIALNKCRDRARREAVRRAFGLSRRGPEETEAVADTAAIADQTLATSHAIKALDRAIAALPSALKEPLVLTVLEGLSQKEAGALLGLSPKAVEVRVYRAKKQLAEALDRDDMDELIPR
ncbi:MAG: polymerase sigma-70 factor,ECF subfamily [Caulobacteraceae bacterium]|nr:polymerase sigma-70 factor,ECF subfamily [Caulobacteraceae bacterium]